MKTSIRVLFTMIALVLVTPFAFAGKIFSVSASGWFADVRLSPPSCSSLSQHLPATWGAVSCDGLDAAVKAGYGYFTISTADGHQKEASLRTVDGMCNAGTEVGDFTVPDGYMKAGMDGADAYVQRFPFPGKFAKNGCMVGPNAVRRCFVDSSITVAPGIEASFCTYGFAETGEPGGEEGGIDTSLPPYTGGGSDPGGGGTGGGNTGGGDTGGGNTGGGNTGGGNTGGGNTGGGNTGGGNTGGGNTGGGNTGGGNTGGGNTGGGNTGGSGDGTGDLCSKHPNLNICKNASWSGSCGDITCNGDAIQCEILRQTAAQECRNREDRATLAAMRERQLGQDILNGNDPDKDRLPSKANAEQLELPKLDTTGWLGGGSCFADKSVTVMGSTVNIPFSQVCNYLVVLRYALMVCALLISFKVLSGAILRE